MRRFGRSLAIVSAVLAPLACQSTDNLPPPLGNCTPSGDASCQAGSASGAGGPGGGGDAGGDASTALTDAAAGACGQADTLVSTSNIACSPCITSMSGCCMADQVCSANADCMALLQCIVQMCASGDPACVGGCESAHQAGISAYQDFASCLQSMCSPQCPTLPTQTTGDF